MVAALTPTAFLRGVTGITICNNKQIQPTNRFLVFKRRLGGNYLKFKNIFTN